MKLLIVNERVEARESLSRLCHRREDVRVVGEADCGAAAIEAAGPLSPDIVLSGVDLPDMSGFDLLRAVASNARPLGIIASNSADHATMAFEAGAFDYLLIPVPAERFDLAMDRARQRLDDRQPDDTRLGTRTTPASVAESVAPSLLVGERQRRLYPLDPKMIDYIEADGNYVTLRVGSVEYLRRDSLKSLSTQLAAMGFVRIERSLLINAAAVSYVEVAGHGTYVLTLRSGVRLQSSAAYRDAILSVIPLPALSRRSGAFGL